MPAGKIAYNKSSSDNVNAIINPVIIPVEIDGSITLKNAFTGVQPRSIAASGKLGSVCFIFGITERIT